MIVGFGGATLDHIHGISHWPGIDETSYIKGSRSKPGGMVLSALFAAAKLGATAAFKGALGDDDEGRLMLSLMEERGVDGSGCFILEGESTPFSQVMVDPEGHRNIFHCRGVRNRDHHDALSFPRLEDADFLLLDGSWIENALIWADEARRRGIPILLDLSPNNRHRLRDELIHLCDYPVLPEMLAQKISGQDEPAAQAESLSMRYGRRMIVTAGERGVFWHDEREGGRHLPAFKVKAVDTNGAGDSFHGALAFALREGMELEPALRTAMAVAAIKCTGHGQERLPDRDQVSSFLDSRS